MARPAFFVPELASAVKGLQGAHKLGSGVTPERGGYRRLRERTIKALSCLGVAQISIREIRAADPTT